jgi:hypothetical protein
MKGTHELTKLASYHAAATAVAADYKRGHGKQGRWVPESVQRTVLAYLKEAVAAEWTVREAIRALNLKVAPSGVYRWRHIREEVAALSRPRRRRSNATPVACGNHAGTLTLTTRDGYEITGSAAEVAALLKMLHR